MVEPAGMDTLAGDTFNRVVSLLERSTLTPLPVAGEESVIVRVPVCPNPTLLGADMPIDPGATTVTVAVVSGMFGPLAWIVVVPSATLITRAPILVEFALSGTVDGTVATLGLLDVKVRSTPPAGAGPDNVRNRVPLFPIPMIVRFAGVMDRLKPTVTAEVAVARLPLLDLTEIVAVPVAMPFTVTLVRDCVSPAAITMLVGDTVAFVGSLLVRSRNTLDDAALPSVIGKATELPGVTDTVAGTIMSAVVVTVTFAVASVTFALLA